MPGRGNKQYCGQALGFWNKNIGIIASTLGWSAQALRGIPWLWYSFVECNPTIMEPPMSLRGLRKNLRAISNPWNDTRDTVDIFTAVLESESWFKSHNSWAWTWKNCVYCAQVKFVTQTLLKLCHCPKMRFVCALVNWLLLFQKSNGTPTKDPKGIKRHFSRAELHLQNQKLDRKIRVKNTENGWTWCNIQHVGSIFQHLSTCWFQSRGIRWSPWPARNAFDCGQSKSG